MNIPELALHHQRLGTRAAHLEAQIERLEAELADDADAARIQGEIEATRAAQRDVDLRLRASERSVEDRRGRLRGRERQLMSGRVSNPTELMRLNDEVEELKASVGKEEDQELELMEQQERLSRAVVGLEQQLEAARSRSAASAPALRDRLERVRAELGAVQAERAATWAQLPPDWQAAYRRVESRLHNPVAEVVGGQCQACRVGTTSSGLQAVRRGALVTCDNCGRILVVG